MGLTLLQLTTPRTREEWRSQLLLALQGIGHTVQSGFSPGSVTFAGTPTGEHEILITITIAGNLGSAHYSVTIDEAVVVADATVPANGQAGAVGTTGISATFVAGPAGVDPMFEEGDTFLVAISTPTLPTTSWQAGNVPLSIVEVDADANEDADTLTSRYALGGYLDSSEGDWLTLYAQQVYQAERNLAVVTKGTIRLTDTAGVGPQTIQPGDLYAGTATGLRFQNTTGGTLTLGGTLDLEWAAEQPGAIYNVANGTITALLTPLAGVTVSNPGPGAGATWITQVGQDAETDPALRSRCRSKWGGMGIGAVDDGYESWAREASSNVSRVLVRASATVPGQTEVWLAGAAGGVDAGTVTTVDNYIQPRVPTALTALVQSAADHAWTVEATIYVVSALLAIAQADIASALQALNANGGIGGTIYLSAIEAALQLGTGTVKGGIGVRNVDLVSPAADVVLGTGATPETGVLTTNLTFVGI